MTADAPFSALTHPDIEVDQIETILSAMKYDDCRAFKWLATLARHYSTEQLSLSLSGWCVYELEQLALHKGLGRYELIEQAGGRDEHRQSSRP